jgi:hypothetical protein
LGIVEAGVALLLLDLLFLAFVIVQIRYLFGGADLVLHTSLSYASTPAVASSSWSRSPYWCYLLL